ncbi:MAG: hypothetical protein SO044_03035 [Agathobaculum sp.]|nr:hypothetical protein [Agathobaculum sp.]MDY3711371.1 hypothetical protein [Agathobaculum sp.]
MKKAIALVLLLTAGALTGCTADVGVIGGADGPTTVIVSRAGGQA